ncbi:MAG: NADPH:quinone oxidoreductase family protein [Candidatus Dormibacteria bacterium]
MKAWVVRAWGAPDSMSWEDVELGDVGPDHVRIRVAASAINFFDALMIGGTYQVKPTFPFTPGGEVAGVVESAPAGGELKSGDRVMAGLVPAGLGYGGYAEVTDTLPGLVRRIPDEMPFEDAAALNIVYQTAHFALHRRARLQAGEVLLVHGAAGGTGTACIQLGKAAGATVIATAGSDEKVALCLELGADHAINYRTGDFVEQVKRVTDGRGADVIFDPVGGDVFDRSTRCIAFEGRLVVIGFTSGRIPEARANHLLVKNYSVVGLHWGAYEQHNPGLIQACAEDLFRLYREARIKPHISATYPLAEAPRALNAVASGKTTGKVLLVPTQKGELE